MSLKIHSRKILAAFTILFCTSNFASSSPDLSINPIDAIAEYARSIGDDKKSEENLSNLRNAENIPEQTPGQIPAQTPEQIPVQDLSVENTNVEPVQIEQTQPQIQPATQPQTLSQQLTQEVLADSAILIEAKSGRVIFEKNADFQTPPASTTKTLTCIIGLEQLFPEEMVEISEEAAYTEDTTFPWAPGDQIQAHKLILGTMMVSDNGGAVAIAEKISGSASEFARVMNEKAVSIGCTNSHFENPNGLPNPNHLTTARDMAKISAYAMKNQKFREIVSTNQADVDWLTWSNNELVPTVMDAMNTNRLLETYPGCTGIKTGWTVAAAGCLAAAAKRGDVELIAVVLHSPDSYTRFEDAQKMLDYGFQSVRTVKGLDHTKVERRVHVKEGTKSRVKVGLSRDVDYTLIGDESVNDYDFDYDLPEEVEAKISVGDHIGDLVVKFRGQEVDRVPFLALEDVDREIKKTFRSRLVGFISDFFPESIGRIAVDYLAKI